MFIFYKDPLTQKKQKMDYNEFKEKIAAGKIPPDVQVKDNIITNNEWLTVDNLRIFHSLSPEEYPKGEILLADIKIAQEKKEQDKRTLKMIEELEREKEKEKWESLTELLVADVQGIIFFEIYPSFDDNLFITFIYRKDFTIIKTTGMIEDEATLTGDEIPFIDFSSALSFCKDVDDCETHSLDGIEYSFNILTSEYRKNVIWSNPQPDEHERQFIILNKILEAVEKLPRQKEILDIISKYRKDINRQNKPRTDRVLTKISSMIETFIVKGYLKYRKWNR